MLEGLELKELLFSQLSIDNEKFRLDDEFFLKKYLKAYEKVKSLPNVLLKDVLSVITDFSANGSYASIAQNFTLLDEEDYAYMIRTTDLEKGNYTKDVKYVDKHSYEFLSKSKLFGGELLINKIGSPGRVFLMPFLDRPVSLGMNLFLLRLSTNSFFDERYLWTFLNTDIGQNIIKRKVNGTVPLTIDKEAVRTLYVPYFSEHFNYKISDITIESDKLIELYKSHYLEAEKILLDALSLSNYIPNNELINIKSFKDSFAASGRLDAEYYQKKYEEIVGVIESHNYDKLSNLVKIKKSIEPGSANYTDEGLPFIRVADYDKFGLTTPDKYLTDEYCKENRERIKNLKPKKGTILFSKDGSIGIAYLLRKDEDFITSGAILHLTVKEETKVLPEYLTLVLNSKMVQMQAERDAGGSIIMHWRISEIEDVVVPIIDMDKQQKIADLVEESFRLKKQSEHLLEVAKRAVEVAIEENEEVAMEYIKSAAEDIT